MSVDGKLRKAARLAKQGNRAGAEALYREVLAKFPANAAARQGLAALSAPGAAPQRRPSHATARPQNAAQTAPAPSMQQMQALERLLKRGDVASVLAEGQRLALLFPKAPALLNLLGLAQSRAGKYEAALATFDRLIRIDPRFAGAHTNRASALVKLGRPDEAIADARTALALDPTLVQAHLLLGLGLVNVNRAEDALIPFRETIRLAPKLIEAHLGLGNALSVLDRLDEALEVFETAKALDPSNPDIANNLGNTLVSLDRLDEAIEALAVAAKEGSGRVVFHTNYAHALRDAGQIDAAVEELDKATALAPTAIETLGLRGLISPLPLDHPDLDRLLSAAAEDSTPAAMASMLEFVLFRAFDKAGDVAEAFAHLQRGNILRRTAEPYDMDEQRRLFETLKAQFSVPVAPLDEAALAEVPLPHRPVFIVGMPRSGTSLTEQILASHSQVYGGGELAALGNAMRKLGWIKPENGAAPARDVLLTLRRSYAEALAKQPTEAQVVTDKTPLNFRWVGHALSAMPEARVLFTRRNSRATCWSNYSNSFRGPGNNFGNDLADTTEMYRLQLDLMDFWKTLFPGRITTIPYEALTEHQEDESRKLVAAAGLDWEKACLDFHKTKRAVRTASASQVRQKMYQGSSESWRRYEAFLGPMLEGLEGLD